MTGASIRSRAPRSTSDPVRRVMLANRPEPYLRNALHALGLRFWKNRRPIHAMRCEADIVFPARRVCIFVDGCFWHGCPLHFHVP